MSPTARQNLKDLVLWALGALLAILAYLAQEVRADVRGLERRNAAQDSALGAITKDLDYIKQGIDDLRRKP